MNDLKLFLLVHNSATEVLCTGLPLEKSLHDHTLTTPRDTLLPRLMSGDIYVGKSRVQA
jgi:hypothetical protein